MKRSILYFLTAVALVAGSSAYALYDWPNPRQSVEFYAGHSHVDGETIGAPEHSGGTDKYGCHNASKPYHCH